MPESKLTQRQKIIFKTIVEEFTGGLDPLDPKPQDIAEWL